MTKMIPPKNIVLYADDDPDDLQLVRDSFSQYAKNVEVITVDDGLEALAYLKNLSEFDPTPCLIILDINMPRMDGKETLQHIRKRERFEHVPVILFTTSSQFQDKNFADQYQAGFLTKPIEAKQMEIITEQFINHCTEEIKSKIRRQMNE